MKRDAAVPLLAVLLLVPALSVAGWFEGRFAPASPAGYYPLALGVCTFFFAAIAPVRRRAWLRPLTLALAAAPFLVFGALEGGGGLPAIGWFLVPLVATLLVPAGRQGAALAALLVTLLGGGAVLAAADLLPGLDPVRRPLGAEPDSGKARRAGATSRAGVALVRAARGSTPAVASGDGPWWMSVPSPALGRRPVLLVLDETLDKPQTEVTVVRNPSPPLTHPFDLAPYDAVLLGPYAWAEDDPSARAKAAALAGFARSGGLLISKAESWPPKVAARLRDAGRIETGGPGGARPLGLGRLARAGDAAELEALLEARLWLPEVATVFDRRAGVTPPVPEALEPWRDRPERRRVQGLLLLAYTLILGAFAWLVRASGALVLVVLLAASVTAVGVVWTSPDDPGFRIHGLALDLGGPGGRRIEALVVSAGPRGFERPVQWVGSGALAYRGGRVTPSGDFQVAPGRTAWLIRERAGLGAVEGDVEDRGAGFLRSLLLGEVDLRRVRFGRIPALPVRIPGVGAVPAATLLYRPAAP